MTGLTKIQQGICSQLHNIWPHLEQLGQSQASTHIRAAAGLLAAKMIGGAQEELQAGRKALEGADGHRLESLYKILGDLLVAIPKAGFTGSGAPKSCADDY